MRNIIDFNHVPPEQSAIHERLVNWERWQRGGNAGNVHPMFRQYRPAGYAEASAPSTVNALDAVEVQKVMKDIPERHRIAVQWFYILRTSPTKVCQAVGCSKEGLAVLIEDGRTMIKNRLTVRKHMCINAAS
jgi:DNA-directed RNA polymerase specialized sigma24 family protein